MDRLFGGCPLAPCSVNCRQEPGRGKTLLVVILIAGVAAGAALHSTPRLRSPGARTADPCIE